jgi:peptidoglycan hydrolase-like protein with peptidoglycan-binding domain
MFLSRASLAILLTAGLVSAPCFAAHVRHTATSGHARTTHKIIKKSHRLHGQQSIGSERATEIQQALIREHYMNGEATGNWDADTIAAMRKFQADQGWQTKIMPDSRALKKLGLGPDYSNAINAKNGNFNEPHPAGTLPPSQAAGFAASSGISR